MLVLFWNSIVPTGGGRLLSFPIAVPDVDLDAFGERLAREGGLCVNRLSLEQRGDGYAYIVDVERVFVAVSGTATVRNYDRPVRREVDDLPDDLPDEREPGSLSEALAMGAL